MKTPMSAGGAIAAACITAAASLLIFTFQQVRHIDERLDKLERDVSLLIGPDGKPRPSPEAIKSHYKVLSLESLIDKLHISHRE